MDANQRSEVNNQTNNLANEKWTPGSKGKTADEGPLDHTYPNGLGVQQQGNQGVDTMGTQQTGAGPGAQPGGQFGRDNGGNESGIPGGSMQTQMNGGSGTVQGITDSHQRQMEQKSAAYGMLEEPVGHRHGHRGLDPHQDHDLRRDVVRSEMNAQNSAQPDLQGGSLDPYGSKPSAIQGTGAQIAPASMMAGPAGGNRQQTSSPHAKNTGNPVSEGDHIRNRQGAQGHDGEEAQSGNTQLGVSGSHAMGGSRNSDFGGVHQSNDAAGGYPRSPGNSGATNAGASTDRAGSQTGTGGAEGGPPAHDSNDAAGGYPRSPGYSNRLAGDRNMDDDTGFKRER